MNSWKISVCQLKLFGHPNPSIVLKTSIYLNTFAMKSTGGDDFSEHHTRSHESSSSYIAQPPKITGPECVYVNEKRCFVVQMLDFMLKWLMFLCRMVQADVCGF